MARFYLWPGAAAVARWLVIKTCWSILLKSIAVVSSLTGRAGRPIKANVRIHDGGRDDSVASAGVDLLAELIRPFEQSASITIGVLQFR